MAIIVHTSYQLDRKGLPSATSFREWVTAALHGARKRSGEVSIVLVDAEEGRQMNLQYRGRDYATNVLSFPVDLPAGVRTTLLGDLIVCAPVVAREAAEQHKKIADHYAHMIIHGSLHLLGHDHIIDTEAERMEALETRILAKLGIADPYLPIDTLP